MIGSKPISSGPTALQ